MSDLTRRGFLATSTATAWTLGAGPAMRAGGRPNERVRVAVMGVRSRGRDLLRTFSSLEDVEIAYICEVDDRVVPDARRAITSQQPAPRVEKDIRRVLDDRAVDAIVVAAPDHWHALATIWACQAGKHVYVEKPISHNLVEGRKMVQAARRHNRVVQVGTQRRSTALLRSAAELVRSGRLGKIPFARTWIAGNRPSIGRQRDQETPREVDYNLWLGPAPERPFNLNRFHYNWHWHWDYGTGELGNNGIHAIDVVRAIVPLGEPLRIHSGGGIHFYEDDRQSPDTQIATFDFENTTLIWEHRIWSRTGMGSDSWGIMIYGERGTMVYTDRGWNIVDGIEASDRPEQAPGRDAAHVRNFIDCIKNGRRPNADIEEGHLSTRLCHLGNIAYRVQRTIHFDARNEMCRDDAEANRLLSRTYRRPFVVPDEV